MQEILIISDLKIKIKDRVLLENASISFEAGDVVLLEGNNGVGKTTFLKTLIGIDKNSRSAVSGSVEWQGAGNSLTMDDKELLSLRSKIAYLEQKDNYEDFYGVTVKDILVDSYEAYKGAVDRSDITYINEVFEKYKPQGATFTMKSKIHKLSGGQQRMVSIIAALCLRKESNVFIIDEPLNNLDISSIVHISNLLNRIKIENPNALFLIISHCKIFPFINKIARFENGRVFVSDEKPVCHACFGVPDENGYYK